MKISKLFLLPTTAVAIAAPMFFSCGKEGWTVEDLEDALFHPLEDEDPNTALAEGIKKMVEEKDNIGLQKEVIYALYANCIFKPVDYYKTWPTIYDLYGENYLSVGANIHKCSLEIEDSGYSITFLGYINFVFVKDYQEGVMFKKGDFIQITYSIDKYHFTISNKALGAEAHEEFCFGFIQTSEWPSIKYIDSVSGYVSESLAPNWHNWTKSPEPH